LTNSICVDSKSTFRDFSPIQSVIMLGVGTHREEPIAIALWMRGEIEFMLCLYLKIIKGTKTYDCASIKQINYFVIIWFACIKWWINSEEYITII